jgi:micrococcal nuclease
MEKRTVLFYVLIVLSIIAIFYCFFSDLIPSVKNDVGDNVVSSLMEQNKEAIEIANELGEFVTENTGKLLPQSIDNVDGEDTSQSTEKYDATGTIQSVVDGSTYIINIDGTETSVCLIGVSLVNNTDSSIVVTEIIKDYLKQGDTVFLEYDIGRTDPNGNTLAYVYFKNGTMVQRWLISNGYVQTETVLPNNKYAAQFESLEQKAKDNQIGLWAYMENTE